MHLFSCTSSLCYGNYIVNTLPKKHAPKKTQRTGFRRGGGQTQHATGLVAICFEVYKTKSGYLQFNSRFQILRLEVVSRRSVIDNTIHRLPQSIPHLVRSLFYNFHINRGWWVWRCDSRAVVFVRTYIQHLIGSIGAVVVFKGYPQILIKVGQSRRDT